MLVALLAILKKTWPYLLVGTLIISGLWYVYYRGSRRALEKVDRAVIIEIERRANEAAKARARTSKKIKEVEKARKTTPQDDERDSCLLSNNPFEVDCL